MRNDAKPDCSSSAAWDDLVAMAEHQIELIEKGNTLVAKQVLKLAARAIRDVLNDQLPDPEQRVYLRFLWRALDGIGNDVDARKALGVWPDGKRHSVPLNRDATLFMAVGIELDRRITDTKMSVSTAIGRVAKRLQVGKETVKSAWKRYGGEDAWKAARRDL